MSQFLSKTLWEPYFSLQDGGDMFLQMLGCLQTISHYSPEDYTYDSIIKHV
jgi:hypothetical protein